MPDLAAILRRGARQAIMENRLDDAQRAVDQLRQQEPLAVETRALELELLIRCGRFDDAEGLGLALVERFPESARVLYLAGRLAYLRKDYPRAERWLRDSERIEHHPWTRRLLGKALTQGGKLDEAEAILLDLVAQDPPCLKDLAWLHERRGDAARAAECLERYLASNPDDAGAQAHLRKLRAASFEPQELIREVDGMLELGEQVPENLWPVYCEAALRLGHRDKVEIVVRQRLRQLHPRVGTSVGWVCYQMQVHDLAFDAFRQCFEGNIGDPKFMAAFEAAARRAGRIDDLEACYQAHAVLHPRLYGRIKRISNRRAQSEE